jgi:hypothetical protein
MLSPPFVPTLHYHQITKTAYSVLQLKKLTGFYRDAFVEKNYSYNKFF